MPKQPPATQEPDLLTLLEEQATGPLPCPHRFSAGKHGSAWVHEDNPDSPYFEEWVHSQPGCRRSAFPGKYKQPFLTVGWSRKLQKDVPHAKACKNPRT